MVRGPLGRPVPLDAANTYQAIRFSGLSSVTAQASLAVRNVPRAHVGQPVSLPGNFSRACGAKFGRKCLTAPQARAMEGVRRG
jgi:hypothetical protein